MKILLDECVDVEFRHHIVGHDVFTVSYMGWKGSKNGQLLALAVDQDFDVLITPIAAYSTNSMWRRCPSRS